MTQLELFQDPPSETLREVVGGSERGLRPPVPSASGMRVVVLGSGSQGNALVVESEHGRLLVDAGFSGREIARRLARVGLEPSDLSALLLTHEHGDHSRGAAAFARRHGIRLHATRGTLAGMKLPQKVRGLISEFRSDREFEAGGFRIEPFGIPHDAREPVGLVIEDSRGCRLGLAADLGCRSRLAWTRLQGLHILILETNHDLDMLRDGPYPWSLKQRVASRHGHLSNVDAVAGLEELMHDDLQAVVLYHLSQTNNRPALAAALAGEELDRLGSRSRLTVSGQSEPTEWIEVI
ncbi:MAG: MBL fold metallo-hydrolase [Thermoanaerobaculia bacterium]|nr:MBL fold metallo-hydrolase [Thermoanaerobaculia bacterium]